MRTCVRTLRILEALSSGEKLSVSELGRMLGLHKSTVYRFLETLCREGYVVQDPHDEKYRLSLKILRLGHNLLSNLDYRNVARPYLEQLAAQTGETAYLAVLDEGQVLYLDRVSLTDKLQTMCKIGDRNFVHCTALGKAQIAYLPEEKVEQIISMWGMPALTSHTITDLGVLKERLAEVRKLGYAVDDVEAEDDVRCVAAPIRDYTGSVVAAVSVSGPSSRVTLERIHLELAKAVAHTARQISLELGYIDS